MSQNGKSAISTTSTTPHTAPKAKKSTHGALEKKKKRGVAKRLDRMSSPATMSTRDLKNKINQKDPLTGKVQKDPLTGKVNTKVAPVRTFSYLGHIPIRSLWWKFLKKSLLEQMHKAENELLSDCVTSLPDEEEHPEHGFGDYSKDRWISSEESVTLIMNAFQNWDREGDAPSLFNPPQVKRSANDMLHGVMDTVGLKTLEGYNRACRDHGRTIINTVDCAGEILTFHGLKYGNVILNDIGREMEKISKCDQVARASRSSSKEHKKRAASNKKQ